MRHLSVGALLVLAAGFVGAAVLWSPWYWPPAGFFLALGVLGVADLTRRSHSVLRNYPVLAPTVRVGGPDCTQPYDMALLTSRR